MCTRIHTYTHTHWHTDTRTHRQTYTGLFHTKGRGIETTRKHIHTYSLTHIYTLTHSYTHTLTHLHTHTRTQVFFTRRVVESRQLLPPICKFALYSAQKNMSFTKIDFKNSAKKIVSKFRCGWADLLVLQQKSPVFYQKSPVFYHVCLLLPLIGELGPMKIGEGGVWILPHNTYCNTHCNTHCNMHCNNTLQHTLQHATWMSRIAS